MNYIFIYENDKIVFTYSNYTYIITHFT